MIPQTRRQMSPAAPTGASDEPDRPRTLAFGLVALGLLLSAAVVGLAALAIYDADGLPLLTYIRSYIGDGRTIIDTVIGSRLVRVRATHTFGHVLSISVYMSVLLTLATVARGLLAAGIRLLTPVARS